MQTLPLIFVYSFSFIPSWFMMIKARPFKTTISTTIYYFKMPCIVVMTKSWQLGVIIFAVRMQPWYCWSRRKQNWTVGCLLKTVFSVRSSLLGRVFTTKDRKIELALRKFILGSQAFTLFWFFWSHHWVKALFFPGCMLQRSAVDSN